jgi:aryl-alcohol dehydrogenase-like predicted oxidoreductase
MTLGGNTFGKWADESATEEIIGRAIDAGVNMVDTADLYNSGRSEELIGRVLKHRRDEMMIATKVGMPFGQGPNSWGSSRKRIIEGCHASLRRLDTDYIDLFLIHKWDPLTPLDEVSGALDDLVRAGEVRYVGCSNYDAWELASAVWVSEQRHLQRYIAIQQQYNLLDRSVERELTPCSLYYGVGIMAYYPLAAGVLTGKYRPGKPWPKGTRADGNPRYAHWLSTSTLELVEHLDRWAHEQGHTVGELALAWLAAQSAVSTVVVGVSKAEQVEANARAFTWRLTEEQLAAVSRLLSTASE